MKEDTITVMNQRVKFIFEQFWATIN